MDTTTKQDMIDWLESRIAYWRTREVGNRAVDKQETEAYIGEFENALKTVREQK